MDSVVTKDAGAQSIQYKYTQPEYKRYEKNNGKYQPKAGDLFFIQSHKKENGVYQYDENGNPKLQYHVGIIEAYNPKTGNIYTIEGNKGDQISNVIRNINDKTNIGGRDVNTIYGFGSNGGTSYGVIPSYSWGTFASSSSNR